MSTSSESSSASGVKNEFLNNVDLYSFMNHLNNDDRFVLRRCNKWGNNDSVNTSTDISDEVNGGSTSMPTSCFLADSKESEDSLDCDGDFLGWYKEMRSGQMTDTVFLQQHLFIKPEEEKKLQLETCIALIKNKYERSLADSHAEVNALRQENEQLRTGLLKAQTEVTHIQTQLDKLKQEFMAEMATPSHLDQSVSPSESVFIGLQSNCEMSTRSCEIVPGSLMPPQRRTLFVRSGLSDSESVLGSLSCEDVNDSDREPPQESDEDTADLQTTSERLSAESPCVSSSMRCKRKPPTGSQIQPKGRLLCEQEKGGPMYRLVLAGDVGSGKSSFLLRLSQHKFKDDMRSTVGIDCKTKHMLVDGKRMALQIWDTAGQERFHSISRSYFRKAHGILLLYDITSKKSFSNITQWLEQIEACTDTSVPMCLVGNKADLREEVPDEQCVSWTCGMRLAKACGALFLETSAKDGTNVVEAVLHLAREVKKVGGALSDSSLQLSNLGDQGLHAGSCCWALT